MIITKLRRKKYIYSIILVLLLFFLEYNLLFAIGKARKEKISGNGIQDSINPKERVSYDFMNNNTFEISTDVYIDLYIEYENNIYYRQTYFIINNSIPISLNISTKSNLQNFGITQSPQKPQKSNSRFQFGYNCIFRIRTNVSIAKLTIRYRKVQDYGLNPNALYSLAIFEINQESWELLETEEKINVSNFEKYIESSITTIQQDTDYYVTIFEVEAIQKDWTWLIITVLITAVGIIALVVLISKKDYFQYLRTRTIPIEKGAHRLSLDDVLENENRNKIIDLILNEPGIHFNELLRKTGLAAGNLVWHLDILITYKVIGKKRIGNFIAYFPYYQKNPISNVDLKLQKSKLTLKILEMIEKKPGIWNNIITKNFKVDHKTIQYHLDKLIDLGLIKFRKEGRKKKIYPNLESDYFNQD
ncbi:MAG: winged helix-turn-helix transcriptional regulator [Candidatus Lokiarchaeota archaeon]|nr:winged helix-turn-helix transcriptional regulator [Candidatus Lokiarchaeota archaeon]